MATPLFDAQGRPVVLGSRLGSGGEGEVFALEGRPDTVAKIFLPKRREGRLDKVQAMVEHPPAGAYDAIEGLPVLTWPRAALFGSGTTRSPGTFQGYLMTRMAPRDFVPFYQLTSSARRDGLAGTPVTWDRLVLLGMRLCHVVRTLHKFGYAVGDLNDRNVLVSRRFTPLLMDTDSFQVPKPRWGHYPSTVGDALYWPPELLDVDLAAHKGDRTTGDRYALAVLLFQLFMGGLRPYQSRGSAVDAMDSLADKTRAGHYPWAKPRRGVLEPPASAPEYQALPPAIRAAFERAFVAGHRKPERRPSADDWYRTLATVWEAGFQPCAAEARHVYGKGVRSCPWCADANDPFSARRAPTPMPRRKVTIRVATATSPARRKLSKQAAAAASPRPTPRRATPVRSAGKPPQRALQSRPPQPPQPILAPPPAPRPAAAPARVQTRAAEARRSRIPRPARRRRAAGVAAARRAGGWPGRLAWLATLMLAFASPVLVLAQMPLGVERKATMVAATILLLFAAGAAPAWRWLEKRPSRSRTMLTGAWLAVATGGAMAAAGAGLWGWLLAATGLASLTLGATVFVLLERRGPTAFWPSARGVLHGALGLPAAYLPVVVLWGWRLL